MLGEIEDTEELIDSEAVVKGGLVGEVWGGREARGGVEVGLVLGRCLRNVVLLGILCQSRL